MSKDPLSGPPYYAPKRLIELAKKQGFDMTDFRPTEPLPFDRQSQPATYSWGGLSFEGWESIRHLAASEAARAAGAELQTATDTDPETGTVTEIEYYFDKANNRIVIMRYSVKSRTSD